jgi:hypothetical protein
MSEIIEVVAAIGIVAYVIGRQLAGEALRGKRVIVLPVVLTVIGFIDLDGSKHELRPVDVACLAVGGILVAAIGIAQASVLRLESRNGALWGQMPGKGLWLWLALILSRVLMTVVADGLNARVAAATSTILLMLGINRLAQAGVILLRATSAGIAFAPEKDGTSLLSGLTQRNASPGTWPAPSDQAPTFRKDRHDGR